MKQYQLISILDMAHILMDHAIHQSSIVCDMTLGNGHDTRYLAGRAKHVYGIDISPQAIQNSKELLIGYDNVTLIHGSHADFAKYLPDVSAIDLFVFNLGYLPGSDKVMTTTKESTIATLEPLFALMKPSAKILLVSYVGHQGGLEEYEAILDFCQTISNQAEIIRYEFLSAPKSAKIIMIAKK